MVHQLQTKVNHMFDRAQSCAFNYNIKNFVLLGSSSSFCPGEIYRSVNTHKQ